jgi:hypothetical protein
MGGKAMKIWDFIALAPEELQQHVYAERERIRTYVASHAPSLSAPNAIRLADIFFEYWLCDVANEVFAGVA